MRAAHADAGHAPPLLAGALTGLQGAASAVVLVAVRGMFGSLAKTALTRVIAAIGFALALLSIVYAPQLQWVPLLVGGAIGAAFPAAAQPLTRGRASRRRFASRRRRRRRIARGGAPRVAVRTHRATSRYSRTFFRAGSLVFGGGHVVLPFLQSLVGPERIDVRDFFAGYGAAQAVPGPLFTFAAFLGAADKTVVSPPLGALVATLGIFAPSFLLLPAGVALWGALRSVKRAPAILMGLNASVVGLLAAVFVDPIGLALVRSPVALGVACAALVALLRFAVPPWLVVLGSAAAGAALTTLLHR